MIGTQCIKSLLTSLFLLFQVSLVLSQEQFKAVIQDVETNEVLPFSIVNLNDKKVKANSEGEVFLIDPVFPISICVKYLGYKDTCFFVSQTEMIETYIIPLEQDVVQLSEVKIRPFTPTEYILKSKKLFLENYANDRFQTVASYEDLFTENDERIFYRTAQLKTDFNHYLDSLKPESHQILFYAGSDSIGDIQFMREKLKKRAEKERKKAKEKGEEFVELQDLSTMMSGPDLIYYLGIDQDNADCLDSSKFKKFEYQFDVKHDVDDEIAILFKSKKKVNHVRQRGRLVFDSESLALKELEFVGEVVLPAVYKPLLWVMGFSLKSPVIEMTVRFQEENGKWYPLYSFWHAQGQIKKRYMFKKNEASVFEGHQKIEVEQLFIGNQVVFIPLEKKYDYSKKMSEQVFTD